MEFLNVQEVQIAKVQSELNRIVNTIRTLFEGSNICTPLDEMESREAHMTPCLGGRNSNRASAFNIVLFTGKGTAQTLGKKFTAAAAVATKSSTT